MRTAMIAMTTSNSISVKPENRTRPLERPNMATSWTRRDSEARQRQHNDSRSQQRTMRSVSRAVGSGPRGRDRRPVPDPEPVLSFPRTRRTHTVDRPERAEPPRRVEPEAVKVTGRRNREQLLTRLGVVD